MSTTLIIGPSSSRCGACGHGCDPHETRHWTRLGYGNHLKHGCGELFTGVTTDYLNMGDRIREMRPDLPYKEPWEPLTQQVSFETGGPLAARSPSRTEQQR